MNYQEAQTYLDELQFHKIKLGLDSMRSFLARVGHPERQLRYVHVAGTNGKGSVSVTILTLLARAGYRVGLYTSPHLSSVRERFRINDDFISREKFAELASRIKTVLGDEKITYFEFTTALALLWFADSGLDLVVLETGLGGRLDATNVVLPLVSVITNVTMDHEAYLGTTIAAIAAEKAGIIKDGVPVVSGLAADEGLEVVQRTGRQKKAPLYLYGQAFQAEEQGDDRLWSWLPDEALLPGARLDSLRCSMRGSYQVVNASLALAVLALLRPYGFLLSPELIRTGLATVRWPGRLEHICLDRHNRMAAEQTQTTNREVICYLLDGAHNPAGVESLVLTLRHEYEYKRLIVIWGAMLDKDLRQTLPLIAELAGVLLLTRPEGERAAEPEQLLEHIDQTQLPCECIRQVDQALIRAEELAEDGDLIVVAGSLYLIGAVRKILLGELVT